jgi:serine/threonine-protein kinase
MAVCGVAAVFGFYSVLRFAGREPAVAVPRIVGLSTGDALATARELGLTVEFADERHDPDVPGGHVVEQEPAAGVEVRPGRRVRVIVSLGSEVVRLQRVIGRPDRQVAMELRQSGLIPGDAARIASRRATPGTVLAQVPSPGSPAPLGTRVHRLVSAGPLPVRWVMPDLVGRRLSDVEDWIRVGGFRRGAVRQIPGGGAPGIVLGHLPPAGHPLSSKGVIELTVAR